MSAATGTYQGRTADQWREVAKNAAEMARRMDRAGLSNEAEEFRAIAANATDNASEVAW